MSSQDKLSLKKSHKRRDFSSNRIGVKGDKNKFKQKYNKYVGNQSEGQGFADKRKRKVMNEYRKILKNERKSMQAKPPISYEEDEAESSDTQPWKNQKRDTSTLQKAQREFQERRQVEEEKTQEILKQKQEREQALAKYHSKKKQKHMKMCKKNFKGQPIMKNQMELLLQKIQSGNS